MNFLRRLVAKTRPRDLIGPPDPISNIRPIIFGGHLPRTNGEMHPYSLNEFPPEDEDDADLQLRLKQDSLNTFNHTFWSDSNTRFMKEKRRVLAELPPMDDQLAARETERALSAFYSRWSAQESARQATYTAEWNARNRAVIRLAMQRHMRTWRKNLQNAFTKH